MSDDQPAEEFRRVTAAAMRAIAERDDITLVYGSEARMVDNQARLPVPSRDFTEQEVASLRGEADAMALRMRFHDEEVHATRAPQGENARAVFESLERVRCEALGSRMMAGVANNLRAALEEKAREIGITVPIIPGVKPLSSVNQLSSIPRYFHTTIPNGIG